MHLFRNKTPVKTLREQTQEDEKTRLGKAVHSSETNYCVIEVTRPFLNTQTFTLRIFSRKRKNGSNKCHQEGILQHSSVSTQRLAENHAAMNNQISWCIVILPVSYCQCHTSSVILPVSYCLCHTASAAGKGHTQLLVRTVDKD